MNSGEKILIKSKYTRVSLILKTQKLKMNSNLSRYIASICQCESYYTTKEPRKQV